ncbi:MAG: hypothetical protein WBD02_08955 [Acidimicrobiia bacterium]
MCLATRRTHPLIHNLYLVATMLPLKVISNRLSALQGARKALLCISCWKQGDLNEIANDAGIIRCRSGTGGMSAGGADSSSTHSGNAIKLQCLVG